MTEYIKEYLQELFTDRRRFISVNGVGKSLDSNYMLVADLLSEHLNDFASLVEDETNKMNFISREKLSSQIVFNAKHRTFNY